MGTRARDRGAPARRRAGALAVLCAASFLAVMDTTIVSIALPTIRREMAFSPAGAQWVLNAYTLVFGGLLLLFGRFADRFGRRRAFLSGLLIFAVGSVMAGLAPTAGVLVLGRFVQGIGAAAFVPSSLSLITTTYPDEDGRSRALAVSGFTAGLGFVVGMVGGGVITGVWGWRWIFLINVPLVVLTVLPARITLAESRDLQVPGRLDVGGAVTATVGLVTLIYALTSAPRLGWASIQVWGAGVAGLTALALLVLVEFRHSAPLIPPQVVARRAVMVSNGGVVLQSMVGIGWLYLLTLYFQEVRGADAVTSGLLFAPMTVAALVGAAVAGRTAIRIGVRATSLAGLVLVAGGLAVMAWSVTGAVPPVVVGMVIGEVGFILCSVALTIAVTSSMHESKAGLAAGLFNTSTQIGGGLGLGIVAALVAATTQAGEVTAGALQRGFLACLGFSMAAFVLVAVGLPARQSLPSREA